VPALAFQRDPLAVHLPMYHEDEGRRFRSTEDHLEARSAVSSALPPRLLVSRERRIDAEPFRQEQVAQLDGSILEVQKLLREVERMMGHHLEHREVLAGLPDVIEVREPHTRL